MPSQKVTKTVEAIKGFDSNMQCRGFQFVEGHTYEETAAAILCQRGFHAVTMPLDVLRYYPANKSVFHRVTLEELATGEEEDSKVAARKISIGVRLSLTDLIKAQVDFVFANSKPVEGATSKAKNAAVKAEIPNGAATASGDYGAATASGYSGAATASGYYGAATASGASGAATASGYSGAATASGRSGAATASGYYGAATASGYYGAATASGDSGAATASGYYGAATASGDYGAATASGYYGAATASGRSGAATASGYYGAATASGDSGAATASGYYGAATASGRNGEAQGSIGSALFLAERDLNWKIINVAAVIVDGKKVKADTFYTLTNGEVVEVG